MTKLAAKLRAEMERWGQKSYAELLAIEYPHAYSVGKTGEPGCYIFGRDGALSGANGAQIGTIGRSSRGRAPR
jgi:hypothetical protein